MAIKSEYPRVKRIDSPAEYYKEMFETGTEEVPSFISFLEDYRGIPKGFFKEEDFRQLALSSEMYYFQSFLEGVRRLKEREAALKAQEGTNQEQLQQTLDKAALEDLQAHANMLKAELSAVEVAINQRAQQIAEQPVADVELAAPQEAYVTGIESET